MNFLKRSEETIENLCNFLDKEIPSYSLLIGGSVGYESSKYDNENALGDIDLFVLIDENLTALFFEKVSEFFKLEIADIQLDQKLFNEHKLSIIRRKYLINDLEISFNLTSFSRLNKIYSEISSYQINKLAYSKTNLLFIANSLEGCSNLTLMLPQKINTQNGVILLVPDQSFILRNNQVYLGLFTDFILKGKIFRDYACKLIDIKNKIMLLIKPYIGNNSDKFISILANNTKFSDAVREKLKIDFDNIIFHELKEQKQECMNKTLYLELEENMAAKSEISQYITDKKLNINKEEDLVKLNNFIISLY